MKNKLFWTGVVAFVLLCVGVQIAHWLHRFDIIALPEWYICLRKSWWYFFVAIFLILICIVIMASAHALISSVLTERRPIKEYILHIALFVVLMLLILGGLYLSYVLNIFSM